MVLQVMNTAFEKLGEVSQYLSASITRSYYGTGAVEITLNPKAANADTLYPGVIVFPSGQPEKACIIEDVAALTRTKLVVRGCMLKGIAKRRVCVPPLNGTRPYQDFGWDQFTGNAESALLNFAQHNLIAPEDPARAIPDMVAAENLGRGAILPWQARFDKLDAILQSIGEATEIGWSIIPDMSRNQYVFGAWVGVDRTTGDALCLISEPTGNASDVQYQQTASGSATTCYIGGAGEDEDRLILSTGNAATGIARRELWAEAGSLSEPELITLYGANKLESAKIKATMTTELIDSGACKYGRDYDVGDKVIARGNGRSMAARLIELTETYEAGGRTLKAVFGDAPVTVSAVLNRAQAATR